jgi:hypothetical protein
MPTIIKNLQEIMTLPNIQNKMPETGQVVIVINNCSDKEFKTVVLRKLNELEENTENCFNILRKNSNKQAKSIFLVFLLVYDSCSGSFIVTFPYIHIFYPGLVHSLHNSPLPSFTS